MRNTAEAFDEWMRLFIEDPESFRREFQDVTKYLEDKKTDQDKVTTYGEECAAFLAKLMEN